MITIYNLIYPIDVLEKHIYSWRRDLKISNIDHQEQNKYQEYAQLSDPEDKLKYTPIGQIFTTGIDKNTFGIQMWNEEGHDFYEKARNNWSTFLEYGL